MLFTAWLSFLTIISQLPGGRKFLRKISFVTVKLSAVFLFQLAIAKKYRLVTK
jgi:thiosulfate reductase cytochrome b subunit